MTYTGPVTLHIFFVLLPLMPELLYTYFYRRYHILILARAYLIMRLYEPTAITRHLDMLIKLNLKKIRFR